MARMFNLSQKNIRGKNKFVKPGMELPGDYYDAHEKMISFDPQYIHTTESFEGTRYAITYYTLARWQELDFTAQKVLKDFGFQLPSTLSEVLRRAPSTPDSEPDFPPLVPESDKEDQSRHVRFGFDTSSDSSGESTDEKPLIQ